MALIILINTSDTLFVSTEAKPAVSSGMFPTVKAEPYNNLLLVNKKHALPKGFIPIDLVNVNDSDTEDIIALKTNDIQLSKSTAAAVEAMFKHARDAGIKGLVISNGYRSYSLQNYYYENKLKLYMKTYNQKIAEEKISMIVAPPGKSEHQTGFALDMTTSKLLKTSDPLCEDFLYTTEGKWINENCWRFGFIIRYQPDKVNTTNFIYEPWHLRYVGLPYSEIMKKNNFCLEEYIEKLENGLIGPIYLNCH